MNILGLEIPWIIYSGPVDSRVELRNLVHQSDEFINTYNHNIFQLRGTHGRASIQKSLYTEEPLYRRASLQKSLDYTEKAD